MIIPLFFHEQEQLWISTRRTHLARAHRRWFLQQYTSRERDKEKERIATWTLWKMNSTFPMWSPIHEPVLNIPKANFLARSVSFGYPLSSVLTTAAVLGWFRSMLRIDRFQHGPDLCRQSGAQIHARQAASERESKSVRSSFVRRRHRSMSV